MTVGVILSPMRTRTALGLVATTVASDEDIFGCCGDLVCVKVTICVCSLVSKPEDDEDEDNDCHEW